MGRYAGTLHKLVGGAHKRSHWNQILNFLEGHSVTNANTPTPDFDSPLPVCTGPSDDLARELLDGQGPKQEDTPLRIACKSAPAYIIAALCHLGPEAVRMADSKGRLPLHCACRNYASNNKDSENVLKILVLAYPEALLHRDEGGRTPLHYLFWFHGKTRSPTLVEVFCQQLPTSAFHGVTQYPSKRGEEGPLPDIPSPGEEGIPPTAAIVPDAKHGALPLHYAVMEGASKEAIKALLQAYPDSKTKTDRKGRTALAWYLGAGTFVPDEKASHVSGEAPNPNAPPLYETHISATVIHALVSSKVARTADDSGSFPFHWAIHLLARCFYHKGLSEDNKSIPECMSLKALQIVLDNHFEVLTLQDAQGRTPLHVLFDAVAKQQELEWQRLCRNKSVRDKVDLIKGGGPGAFAPPAALLELLLQSPGAAPNSQMVHAVGERPACAAHMEDEQGRLPLHCALHVATNPKVVKALIQSHPFGLVHTTEETLQTPLHMLLSSPFATPLVTAETVNVMLEAYVTSRHGTFVNGRLALKMEDSCGRYPLHLACENLASLEVIQALLGSYPKAARFQSENGDLPIHSLLETKLFGKEKAGPSSPARKATLAVSSEWVSDAEVSFREKQFNALQQKMRLLMEPLVHDKASLKIASLHHGMTPLHIAVAFDVLPYGQLYRMVETYPKALKLTTAVEDHGYTPLDLHEQRRSMAEAAESWHMVRELLFSFCPTLDAHRRKEALLDRCVKVIRDELEGKGSLHLAAQEEVVKYSSADLQLTTTLSSIEAPSIDLAVKPKKSKIPNKPKSSKRPKNSKTPKAPKQDIRFSRKKITPKNLLSPSKKDQLKSIYDEDLDAGYTLSPTATHDEDDEDDEDDDYFSEEEGSDREYRSDDYDSRYDDELMFDDDTMKTVDDATRQDVSNDDATRQSQSHDFSSQSTRTFEDAYDDGAELNTSREPAPSESVPTGKENVSGVYALSEVARRLWLFFALFRNPDSLEDHYARQVTEILDGVDISSTTSLVSGTLPSFATGYLEIGSYTASSSIRDVAHVQCRAAIHRMFYFVGRYEFLAGPNENLLIHRNGDGESVLLRATEHIVSTEDVKEEVIAASGNVEERIWETGEHPLKLQTPKAVFSVTKRTVCFKFMRSEQAYKSEVECRKMLGIPVFDGELEESSIVPLINHFSANVDTENDKLYKRDIQDERFRIVSFDSSAAQQDGENSVNIANFPYAVVMHHRDDGDLQEYYYHHGVLKTDQVRGIGAEIAMSLKRIHENGLLHGNVSFRGVKSLQSSEEKGGTRYWALSDLSCARPQASASYMAGISATGTVHFATGTFPPEMFVKLNPAELKMYSNYWDCVMSTGNVAIERGLIEPQFDPATGDAYVLRCHFLEDSNEEDKLPELPYKLVPVRQAADIWSFGQILFTLCSGGHPLFATNVRTGHLLDHWQIGCWSRSRAKALIYGNVDDPLAQDILLHLLSPFEERAELNMQTVLSHPFFANDHSPKLEKMTKRIVDKRIQDCASHRRKEEQELTSRADEAWLQQRTRRIVCWDLGFQRRIYMSPSELIRKEFSSGRQLLETPSSFVLIPYKLSKNKSGKLTPSTKKDVELAEGMGIKLLALSKACHYACLVENAAFNKDQSFRWSSKDLLQSLRLSEDFRQLDEAMIRLAATEVERFRDDPMIVARLIVQERVLAITDYFEESGRAFLYLIDENEGVPVTGNANSAYPVEIKDDVSEVVQRGLPLMHLCGLYMRGLAGGVAGLVKLIFEGAYPLVPPSWAAASSGLTHRLDETEILRETRVLEQAISDAAGFNGTDGVRFFQTLLRKEDPKRSFCDLKRVTNGEASLWTSSAGEEKLDAFAKEHSLSDTLRDEQRAELKSEAQARRIAELEKRLEDLEFHKKLNISDFNMEEPVSENV